MSSTDGLQFLEQYGVAVLPALMVAEQVGIPLPAVPAILGVGALAAQGRASIPLVLSAMAAVALVVDFAWYEAGSRRGARLLGRLCRLSLEPDSCVRRTENVFAHYGVRALLVAKFVPGFTTVTPPLAGMFGVPRVRFALYDLAGVVLWAGTWLGTGYLFSEAISLVAVRAASLGRLLGVVVVVALAGYVGLKALRRRLFLRTLRTARITPDDLKRRLDQGDALAIIDLRTPLDLAAVPYAIPGSRWIASDEIDEPQAELLRGREVVLYCSCPNEATSARVALQLKRRGITRVHPLEGGLARWMELNFPVEARPAAVSPSLNASGVGSPPPEVA